jgi:hypothetical protein
VTTPLLHIMTLELLYSMSLHSPVRNNPSAQKLFPGCLFERMAMDVGGHRARGLCELCCVAHDRDTTCSNQSS